MANNRMFLVNDRTGEKVMLAKYYPSQGSYVHNEDLIQRLDAMFDEDHWGSMWGATDYHLEFEQVEPERWPVTLPCAEPPRTTTGWRTAHGLVSL